jgi:hypothetical protein
MAQRVTGALQNLCVASAVITPLTARGDWAVVRKLLTIPDDALLVWGYLQVITAFDDSTTLTIDLGHAVDPNLYTTAPIDLTTVAVTALAAAGVGGVQYGQPSEVQATFAAGTGDAAIGKAVAYLAYVRPDKSDGVG